MHSSLLKAGEPGPTTVAKGYRLLHAILNTAVDDELLVRNPCVITGAGQEKPPERPIASIPATQDRDRAIACALNGLIQARSMVVPVVLPSTSMGVSKRSVSLDDTVADRVEQAAEEDGMSFSAWLSRAAEDKLLLRDGFRGVREWECVAGDLTAEERAAGEALLDRLLGDRAAESA